MTPRFERYAVCMECNTVNEHIVKMVTKLFESLQLEFTAQTLSQRKEACAQL